MGIFAGGPYAPAAVTESLSLATRVWFAFACFFRVLFDGSFAARAFSVRDGMPELPEAPEPEPEPSAPDVAPALQLLGLLQRDGRLVDFLQQDVAGFSDAEIGAAARVVHEGCRKALASHAKITPVRTEDEGDKVTIGADYDPASVKLVGNVAGSGPFTGVLRHKGWRAEALELPALVGEHDAQILAPAEVEL